MIKIRELINTREQLKLTIERMKLDIEEIDSLIKKELIDQNLTRFLNINFNEINQFLKD